VAASLPSPGPLVVIDAIVAYDTRPGVLTVTVPAAWRQYTLR
jgi:hypothetical protein